MSLSDRQRDELHRSMLSYLKSQGLTSAYKVLCKELAIDQQDAVEGKKYDGLLEKKWMSVIRLQKKIMDLEQSLSELRSSIPSHHAVTNGKVDLTAWIPRAPARHSLSGHRQPITSIAFHPSFNLIATSSEDSSIKIWDWETGDFEKTLKSHTKAVTDIDFSPAIPRTTATNENSRPVLLASCSNDLTIKLWDSENDYNCLKTLHGHDHVISSVKFISSSGDRLASVSRDRSVKIWEVDTGFCVKTIEHAHGDWIRSLSPSFDGLSLLTAGSDQIAKIHDITTSKSKMEFRGHEHVIECAVYAPPSTYKHIAKLAGAPVTKTTAFAATGSRDKTIKLWKVENGVCIMTLNGHDNWVRALVFHPDGQYLLSASDDKSIKVWDLAQGGRCCRTIEDAHGHFVSCLSWGLSASQVKDQRRILGQDANGSGDLDNGKGRYVIASGGVDQIVKIWLP